MVDRSDAYSSNNDGTIQHQFSLEGDALKRAGFLEPASLRVTADDTLSRADVAAPEARFGLTGVHLAGYELYLAIGDMALDE